MVKTKNAALNFIIAGDPSGAQKAMRVVGVEADGLGGKMKALGGFLTAGALVRWGQQSIDVYRRVGGEQLKLQRLTGTTEEQASGLWVAAQQSGLGVDKLAAAVGILSTKIRSGATAKLGLDLTDAQGKALPLDQSLRKIADRVSGMADGAEKNSLVRALFGRSGTDLIPLLNKGGAALDEFIAKAESLGMVLDSESIKQATKNQRDFQLATTAASYVIGKELLPVATAFTSWASRELPRVVGFVTTVADTFGALPGPIRATVGLLLAVGPAVKVLAMVAAPFKAIAATVSAGRTALDGFRLGLMGVTQAGAGAANTTGAMLAALGPTGVGVAVAGIGLVTAALIRNQQEAQRSKANVEAWRASLESGMSPFETSVDLVTKTLTEADGKLQGLKGSGSDLRAFLDQVGVGTRDLAEAMIGSPEKWQQLTDQIGTTLGITEERWKALQAGEITIDMQTPVERQAVTAMENLEKLRQEGLKGQSQWEDYKRMAEEAGLEVDDTTGKIITSTSALEEQSTSLERAKAAIDAYTSKMNGIHDAEDGVVDAHRASADAQADLAEARRAAAGDSDEYRSAVEAIADAEDGVRDAQEQVADAQRGVLDAQADLNDARAEAAERLRDVAAAARDAALAEDEANLKVKESRDELRRVLADPRATATEKERAQLELRKAEEEARQAAVDNRDAQAENQSAQAAGVEGDERVVEARKRVADANRKVTEAERGVAEARKAVADAERRAAKVIVDARADVIDAQRRAEDAALDEAKAWGDLAEAQGGAIRGQEVYQQRLKDLYDTLDPNSPFAQRIASFIAELDEAIRLGRLASSGTTVTPPTRDPDRTAPPSARGNGDLGAGGNGAGGSGFTFNQTNIVQGTSAEQLRIMRNNGLDAMDKLARSTR